MLIMSFWNSHAWLLPLIDPSHTPPASAIPSLDDVMAAPATHDFTQKTLSLAARVAASTVEALPVEKEHVEQLLRPL